MSQTQDNNEDTIAAMDEEKHRDDPKKKGSKKKGSKGKTIVEDENGEGKIVVDEGKKGTKKEKKEEDLEFEEDVTKKKKSTTRSFRAGLQFPVGRIDRFLRSKDSKLRVGSGAPIYMAAVLEYLTAELLEISGTIAMSENKKRISPVQLKRAISDDPELNRLWGMVISRGTKTLNPLSKYDYNIKGDIVDSASARLSKREAEQMTDEINDLIKKYDAVNVQVKSRASYAVIKRLRQKENTKG